MSRTDNSDSDHGIERALTLLAAILSDSGKTSLNRLAAAVGVPRSTAYRLIRQFIAHGMLIPSQRGHFMPGLVLTLPNGSDAQSATLAAAARLPLRRLAKTMRATAHMGIIENDMVTYVVKEHGGGPKWFTKENQQLEAYCSAIGKVLLSGYPEAKLREYLTSAPFVPLTPLTVTSPEAIREEVERVRTMRFASDDREVSEDLICIATPICASDGSILAAVSLSRPASKVSCLLPPCELLACAAAIERRLGQLSSK